MSSFRLLIALGAVASAISVKTPLQYFKASINALGDAQLFGGAAGPTDDHAEALLSQLLLHESKTSYRARGDTSQWLACSADYAAGTAAWERLLALDANPQLVHSSRKDDCICFMAFLTAAEAEAAERDFVQASEGRRVLGMLEPYPSAFKLPRRMQDASQLEEGGLGEWAFSKDHYLVVRFAPGVHQQVTSAVAASAGGDPKTDEEATAASLEAWMGSRLEKLGSSEHDGDFFWSLESEGRSEDDHAARFGTGSVARAWRRHRSTAAFRSAAAAAGGCGYAQALKVSSPVGAWLKDQVERGGQLQVEISGHHKWQPPDELGDRSPPASFVGGRQAAETRGGSLEQREACVRSLLVALVTSPEVTSVQVAARKAKSTNMAAARLVQAGGTDNTLQPMWNAGLTGTGQVIQVGDTGVDQYHCLFHDESSGPVSISTNYKGTITTDMTLRKVVQYVEGEDADEYDCDGSDGHGTHVAGSALGGFASDYTVSVSDTCSSSSDTDGLSECDVPDYYSNCASYLSGCSDGTWDTVNNYYCDQTCYCTRSGKYYGTEVSGGTTCEALIADSEGTAKGAKLAVLDLMPESDCSAGTMTIGYASNLYNYYWPAVYDIGKQSRISTNSWGYSDSGEYSVYSYITDFYTFNYPDFVS